MAFHVTQCPGCESTFNTSARVLETAAGQVRCGACLTVFTADEHFISTNDVDHEEDADTSVFVGNNPFDYFDPSLFLTRQSLTAPELPRDAFATGYDRDDETEAVDAEDIENGDMPTFGAALSDQENAPENKQLHTHSQEDDSATSTDEAYFDLGDEDEESDPASITSTDVHSSVEAEFQSAVHEATDPDTTTHLNLTDAQTPPSDFDTPQIELDAPADDVPSYSAFEFVPEDDAVSPPESIAATDTHVDADAATRAESGIEEAEETEAGQDPDELLEDDDSEDDSTEAIRARARRALFHDDEALEALPAETRSAIGRVLPPLELLGGRDSRWGRRLLLSGGCLLLGGLLALQYLWQHLPTYSQLPGLRPFYAFACDYAPCSLPAFTDITAIRSDSLQVRSHPRRDDALAVSLSFRNTAAFPQAFPILILSFNSATNAVIALREFAPEEYLDEGLRELTQMPVMSPVQVEMELMDPGADAVNYTVAFRRP